MKAENDFGQQARLDAGTEIGERARKTFPGGILVDREYWDLDSAARDTTEAIKSGANTVYEAAFCNEHYHCRLDILHRKSSDAAWEVFEVKSGLDAKPEYILDLAIQCWILNQCGFKWHRAHIVHVNRDCRNPDLENLFVRKDVTDAVQDILVDLDADVEALSKAVASSTAPEKEIGRHCQSPYPCGFKAHCWKDVPAVSVFSLPGAWRLFDKGRLRLEELTPDDLSPSQVIPFEVVSKDYTHIDKHGIKEMLSSWKFPFYHLDFETVGHAIPRYQGTGPYNNVPFQFSLHIQSDLDGTLQHKEYLHTDTSDPRRAIAEKLVAWIPKSGGTVVAYNSSFEAGVIRKLAEMFGDLAPHLLSIADRLADPHPVIKANVYHKHFRGGFSMKDVAPALLGDKWDYGKLVVGDGRAAQVAFDMLLDSATSTEEKQKLRVELLRYCAQDTLAMVELVRWLYLQAG